MEKKKMNNTEKQADDLIKAMRQANVEAFHENRFGLASRRLVELMVTKAKRLHRIAENHCNGREYKGMLTREANLEKMISELAKGFGLTVVFDGDPRGYVVKLHAPNKDVYNTWGGKESGYGIG